MIRLNKKEMMPSKNPLRSFFTMPNFPEAAFFYLMFDARPYSKRLLVKETSISLPCTDVYEIKANSQDGLTLGYCFDCYGRVKIRRNNVVGSSNVSFVESLPKLLNSDNLQLKLSINNLMIFEYEGSMSIIVKGFNSKTKEMFEIM